MATTDIYHVSGSLHGRKAVAFIGGNVDDYLQVNAFAAARVAANDTTGTFSFWMMTPTLVTASGANTIIGCGDDNVVEFLEINQENATLTCRCTDATVVQFASVTGNVIKPFEWMHVAVVQRANGAGVEFYVNGARVSSTNTTATDVDEWFNNLDGIDTARIGAANKAGDSSVTQEFQGALSDVKYWNTALTPEQVYNDYIGSNLNATLNASNLQSHWDFDDDYVDNGLGADNGTAVGDITLVNNYCEFTCRLRHMTGVPVVADSLVCFADQGVGHAVVIQAA